MGLLLGLRGGTLAPSRLVPLRSSLLDTVAVDTFTDTDGTALTSHTADDGGTWTIHGTSNGGSSSLDGNQLHKSDDSFVQIAYHSWQPPTADYAVSADVILVTDNNLASAGVYGRLDSAVHTGYYLVYATSGNAWQLWRVVGGATTQLGSNVAQTLTVGQAYRATLALHGSTLTVLVDGAAILTVTDTAITAAGRAGVRLANAATATVGLNLDTFRVRR